jgi:hypothetical protein
MEENSKPIEEKRREIPCVATTGMTGASDALAPESLLEAALAQTASSVRRFFKENPEKFREVRYFTLICDQYGFNNIQELADSLKPGWTPPE